MYLIDVICELKFSQKLI